MKYFGWTRLGETYHDLRPKPVGYLVFAWIAGIASALMVALVAATIDVAYRGEFEQPLWQQALGGLLFVPVVMLAQMFLAMTVCAAILHSRSQRVFATEVVGTGYHNTKVIVMLPLPTTEWAKFWIAVHHSGWRVIVAIYAVVLAVVVTSAAQLYVLGVLLVAVAVVLGVRHAALVKKIYARMLELARQH